MAHLPHTWVIVLAAGHGKRLSRLTADDQGVAVPKQFCSLYDGCSLLREALRRAAAVAPPARICAVVAAEHRQWWTRELQDLPSENIVVQPANRGTAIGILLPLLRLLRRDPDANVLLLPSDHHVQIESILAAAMRDALHQIAAHPSSILMLGIEPDEADPEMGYIVPETLRSGRLRHVARFVEKPHAALARELMRAGALWNAFIIAAHGRDLLRLFERQFPAVVSAMRYALQRDQFSLEHTDALGACYAQLHNIDFSHHLLPGAEGLLQVLPVPRCGWNDLGTPQRLAVTLQRERPSIHAERCRDFEGSLAGVLSLAAQHERLGARAAAVAGVQ